MSLFCLEKEKSLACVTPDQIHIHIPQNKKRKKTPDSSVIRKEPIVDTVNLKNIYITRRYSN